MLGFSLFLVNKQKGRLMRFTPLLKVAVSIMLIAAMVSSCRKNQQPGWNTQLLVPIATTTLSLQNLVSDSSLKTNADSSLTLAYQTTLYQFNLADQIVKIPDTSIGQKFTLDSLTLPQSHVVDSISLGAMAINMLNNSSTSGLGGIIIAENLQQPGIPIPPMNNILVPPYVFDASGFFDSAYITSATIQIEVTNNLPIDIGPNTILTLRNASTNLPVVLPDTIRNGILSHGQAEIKITIQGPPPVFITNKILFEISNLNSPGSRGANIVIDTSNSIKLSVNLLGMHVSQAWAKFPNQGVVNQTADLTIPIADRKFTYIDARSGAIHIYATNSVPQPLYLEYTLVGAYNKQGKPLTIFTTIPAATPATGPQTVDKLFDISGYSINLTGQNGSSFNTYTQRVVARIDATGVTEHITLADSLNIRYEIQNIAPNYIKGYAGRDTINANDSAAFSFLNIFKSGSVDLQSVKMNFNIVNGIGVDGQVRINSLTAISPTNGSQTLTSTLLGKPLTVNRSSDYPLTPAVNNFSFNNSNSNIKNLIGILPTKLLYNVQVQTNVNGNTGLYRDFAYLQSNLDINLNAEVPLSLLANHLVLKDTIGFNLSNTQTNVNGITDGIINVIAENKYPIEAILTMVIYDGNWNPVDTLMLNRAINAASLDNNCRAQQPMRTVVQESVTQARMNRIKQGQNAIITADFSTSSNNALCNGQHLKIYSDYTIGITLSAKFNYKVAEKL
jgi:hypothetical protein